MANLAYGGGTCLPVSTVPCESLLDSAACGRHPSSTRATVRAGIVGDHSAVAGRPAYETGLASKPPSARRLKQKREWAETQGRLARHARPHTGRAPSITLLTTGRYPMRCLADAGRLKVEPEAAAKQEEWRWPRRNKVIIAILYMTKRGRNQATSLCL